MKVSLNSYIICVSTLKRLQVYCSFHSKVNRVIFFQGTNDLREMKYPKVQKYCLMSVRGCYTGKNFSELLSLFQMISNKSYK